MARVMQGGARCKATSPGDHPGKTVLHSLELEHAPNCDIMQQGVAVDNQADWTQEQMLGHLTWSRRRCFLIRRKSRM